jgi:VWFA-related protein
MEADKLAVMSRLGRRFAELGTIAVTCTVAMLGQATPNTPPATSPANPVTTLQVQSQLVFVPTTVELGKDNIVYNLKASQFVIEDNGVPQQVRLDDTEEAQPLSLVVAVQCSRSAIEEFNALNGLPVMIDALLGGAPAEVAVIQFGTGEQLLAGFTHNKYARDLALSRITPCNSDGDNIFDAVDYANTLLVAHHATGRRAILLISETRDHGSETKSETVIHELGRSNTIVDAMSFSPERDEMVDDLHYGGGAGPLALLLAAVQAARKNAPKEFANLSGGEYINFRTQKTFDRGMGTLANHVHNFYMLSFVPRFPPDAEGSRAAAPGLHRITVKIPDFPKAIIRHRESYWAEDPSK